MKTSTSTAKRGADRIVPDTPGRPAGSAREPGPGKLSPAELALMRAVLQDAILCYLGRAKRRRVDGRILAREAEHWIRIHDWDAPFSFNNVCEALGLCHETTRRTILSWRAQPAAAPSSFAAQRV